MEYEAPLYTASSIMTFEKYRNFAILIAKEVNGYTKRIRITELALAVLAVIIKLTGSFIWISFVISMIVVPFALNKSRDSALKKAWDSNPARHDKESSYSFYKDEVISRNKDGSMSFRYSELFRVIEGEYQFYFMNSSQSGFAIDKINCSADLQQFIRDIAKDVNAHNKGKKK